MFALQNGCHDGQGNVFVPSAMELVHWIINLQAQGFVIGTLKRYLCAVSFFFELHGHPFVTRLPSGPVHPTLSRLLRGIAMKTSQVARLRLPVTTPTLSALLKVFDVANKHLCLVDRTAIKSALKTAVHGLMRVGEFTCKTTTDFRPNEDLLLADVASQRSPYTDAVDGFAIVVKHGKSDKFRQTAPVGLHRNDADTCPVTAMQSWLAMRTARPNQPLHALSRGRCLARQIFTAALRRALDLAGYHSERYGSHSCRGGGCVSYVAAGASTASVCSLGRWASNSYMNCTNHLLPDHVRDLQLRVSQIGSTDITQDHHTRYVKRFEE